MVCQQCWGNGLIRARGSKFVDATCQEYVFNGWNSWEMIETAAGVVSPSDWSQYEGKDPIGWMLDTAMYTNLCSLRLFGHGHDAGGMQLQLSPGQYDENAMRGLDIVLNEAGNRGIRVIITFADNWQFIDSKRKYVEWSGSAYNPDDFYFDQQSKDMFKNHINFMVNRVNSVNGRTYRDDPTILAWNLMNEPRCECDVANQDYSCTPECTQSLQAWIEEMSSYTKSVDPNHMVTVGEEGFYGWWSGREWVNPDSWQGKSEWESWAMKSGQNYTQNHYPSSIDFGAVHIWVDNWELGDYATDFFNMWIDEHMKDTRMLNKPLVIEEFGKKVWYDDQTEYIRDPYFYAAYDQLINSMKNEDVLGGSMWWEWEVDEKLAIEEYAVKTYQSTWHSAIVPKSAEVRYELESKPRVHNCVPGGSYSYDAIFLDSLFYQDGDEYHYYISRGNNMLSSEEGDTVYNFGGYESVSGASATQCAYECEQLSSECSAFSYNPNLDGGTCYLKSYSSDDVYFSMDGWQTYWRATGSGGCNGDSNCNACSSDGVCISCISGYLLQGVDASQAQCKSCYEFSQAIQYLRPECWAYEE